MHDQDQPTGKDSLTTAGATRSSSSSSSSVDPGPAAAMMAGALPPVLGRLLRGSFWLALKSPVQALIAFWTFPLTVGYIGDDAFGAYGFAWGFGFLQFLLEFGMSSALQRQISDAWTRGDRASVERAVACGTVFYAGAAALQAAVLLSIARWGVPYSGYYGESAQLVVKLLLLQAVVSPAYGLSVVAASVLQAARRYDFIPRLDLAIVLLRFLILVGGIWARLPFFQIVVIQIAAQLALGVVPATWVMVRELGIVPRFRGASWLDFNMLLKISLYVFLIQLSVVLADRIDTTILGFALPKGVAGPATTVYQVVSKPFFQIRQTGWMLCYLVMPAVASLAAAQDRAGLERILYDGSRLLIGLLLPVALLAGIDAAPFLTLWMGPKYAEHAWLLRLFLIAALPLLISVLVQMAIGLGKVEVIAFAALGGAAVNLPLSYVLTLQFGMPGVIWGTVLTTLVSNLLIPAWYVGRVLEVRPGEFLSRTLAAPLAGGAALVAVVLLSRWAGFSAEPPPGVTGLGRLGPFAADLALGCAGYAVGYLLVSTGREDLRSLSRKLRRRRAS